MWNSWKIYNFTFVIANYVVIVQYVVAMLGHILVVSEVSTYCWWTHGWSDCTNRSLFELIPPSDPGRYSRVCYAHAEHLQATWPVKPVKHENKMLSKIRWLTVTKTYEKFTTHRFHALWMFNRACVLFFVAAEENKECLHKVFIYIIWNWKRDEINVL